MRTPASALAAILAAILVAATARAASDPPAFPHYDVEAFCRVQANYSFAATLGDSSFDRVLANCEAAERDAMASARALWTTAAPRSTAQCLDLAEGRYTYLTRCLDSSRTVRTAR